MTLEFGKYLRKIRKEKGLTLKTIELQSGVSNAYLSQIENGKRGVPTPDILMKIHKSLGVPYDELMERAGYISSETRSELHPETIKTMESYDDLIELLTNAADIFISSITDESGKLQDEFKEELFKETEWDYPNYTRSDLDKIINEPNFNQKLFEYLTLEEKISFLNILIKDFAGRGINLNEVFKNETQRIKENSHPILHVPVLGYIAAGQPILAHEHIDEWIEIPNMWNLKENEAIVLKVKGDSMIGSRIFEGDKVVVKLQQDVENGEIAVVNVNGDEATLKKVKKTENGQVILYPDNPKYEPIFITHEKARIIGKVVQVMFEPK